MIVLLLRPSPWPVAALAVGSLIDGVDSLVVLYFFKLTFNSKMGTVLCFFIQVFIEFLNGEIY